MKKRIMPVLLAPLSVAVLSACGSGGDTSRKGNIEDYVVVNFYTDYVGIDYAHPDASQAKYLGKCYLLKSDEKDVRATLRDVEKEGGEAIDYRASLRTPTEGKHYAFDGWSGVYSDGTAIDSSNISHDFDSCNLFAHFELMVNVYDIEIVVQGSNTKFSVEHGTKFSEAYPDYASAAYQGAQYYEDYSLNGYTVTVDSVDTVYSISNIADYEIKSDATFTADFAKTTAHYSVTIKDEIGTTLSVESVLYDEELTYVPAAPAGYVFSRYEGTYPSDEGTPKAVAGRSVDVKHIRYNCTLVAHFAKENITVTFRNEDNTADVATLSIPEGSSIEAPSFQASSGNVFTGDWYTSPTDTSLEPFDLSNITSSVTLHPRVLPKEVSYSDGANSFLYRYDHMYRGYGLWDFDTTAGSVDLDASSFFGPSTFVDPRYGFVSICDLDEDNDGANRKIHSISLPTATKAIYADSMMALEIAELDLTACTSLTDIQFHAFRRCLSMTDLKLPSSLVNVGTKIAEGNSSLSTFSVAMTEQEKNNRNFEADWDYVSDTWNASHSVTFA